MLEVQVLILIIVANGSPIVIRRMLSNRFGRPLDGGIVLADGQPLLGRSKTVRGLLSALILTPPAAVALGLTWEHGITVAAFSMLGDLCSSFIKRRLGLPSSSMALGLDQVPESLFPLLACREALEITWTNVALLVLGFFVLELLLSRILYHLKIRGRPY